MTYESIDNETADTAYEGGADTADSSDIIKEDVTDDVCEQIYGEESSYSLEEEIAELSSQFPDMIRDTESTNSERYSELRAMGLSMREAYLATSEKKKTSDTRTHLRGGMPIMARSPVNGMSRRELEIARSIFDGMSDDQIRKLYNRVKS